MRSTEADGGGILLGTECSTPICALSWATLSNTLIAHNQDSSLNGPFYDDCKGELTSEGFNLVQEAGIGQFEECRVAGDLSGVQTGVDPDLEPDFQFHGGQTTWDGAVPGTYALLDSSVAIDAGNPSGCRDADNGLLPHDQRYAPRVGTCDVGAYEFDGVPMPPGPLFRDGFESGSTYLWSQ